MSVSHSNPKVAAYQQVAAHGGVAAADGPKLIAMMLDGALARIAEARGFAQRGATVEKSRPLQRALAIVAELRACLALEHGTIPRNLDRLYDYVGRQLLRAHTDRDPRILDDAALVLNEIRLAWNALPEAAPGRATR